MADKDKRRLILLAAETLFTHRRFHEITLDEVAREAGVGKGTIYQYFKDKDDLFFQVATSGFEELCELLRQHVRAGNFAAQLRDACVEISAFFDHRRRLFRMMLAEEVRADALRGALRERWLTRRRELRDAVAEIFRRGVAEGAVRSDIAPEALASFLLGMLRARAHDLADAGVSHDLLVDLLCRGACATPARPAARKAAPGAAR